MEMGMAMEIGIAPGLGIAPGMANHTKQRVKSDIYYKGRRIPSLSAPHPLISFCFSAFTVPFF